MADSTPLPLPVKLIRFYLSNVGSFAPKHAAKIAFRVFCTPFNKKVRQREVDVLKTAQKQHENIDGLKIATYSWGTGDQLAILVHGWEGNAGSLGGFVQPLVDAGYRVVAFDGPAHGASSGKQTNLFAFSKVLEKLIQKWGTPDVILAHSFGSGASILAASNLGITIPRVVLLTVFNHVRAVFDHFYALAKLPHKAQVQVDELVRKRIGFYPREVSIENIAPQSGFENVLMLHDINDKIILHQSSVDIVAKWENADLESLQDVGHYRMLWREEVIARAMQFIEAKRSVSA